MQPSLLSMQLMASGALLMRNAAEHGELDQVIAVADLMLTAARPYTDLPTNNVVALPASGAQP